MNINQVLKERRKAHLKDKFTIKGYSEKWHGLRLAMLPVSYLLQIIPAFCAVSLPAYGIKVITGSWYWGFLVGAVILFAFEYIKRSVVNNTALSYFNAGKVSVVGGMAVLLIVSASVASSGFGTPILIEAFAPMPAKPIENEVNKPFDKEIENVKAHWDKVKQDAEQKAKEVHKANNWKGVTVKGARATVLGFKQQAKAAVDSLNSSLASIEARRLNAASDAKSKYLEDTATRIKEKANVGFWLALVTLLFEVLFICCYGWLNYYDFHQALELGLITFESGESRNESAIIPEKVVQSKVKAKPQQRPSVIGFNNEGKVVNEAGKLKIICKKANGELKAYDSAYLSTLISSCEGERERYFREMKEKLKQAKKL